MEIEKERLEKLKKEREQQLIEKKRLQATLDQEKEQILKEFELKKNKLIHGQLSNEEVLSNVKQHL